MSSIGRISKALLFTTLTLASAPGWASAGKVVISTGDVFAVDSDEQRRTLQRRSDVFEGDTLITGEDSRLQLRFEDNAILALRANSQLRISEYHGASDTEEERVLMDLLGGGFRTISGSFGSEDRDAYQVRTPNASIGIRGTHYEAVFESETLTVGVYDGGISVTNDQGTLNLGSDSDFLYAQVEAGGTPQGLLNPPENLNQPNTPQNDEEDGEENSDASNDEGGDDSTDGADDENDSEIPEEAPQNPEDLGSEPLPLPDGDEISEDDFDFSDLENDLNEESENSSESEDEQNVASLLSDSEKQNLNDTGQAGFVVFSPSSISTDVEGSLSTGVSAYGTAADSPSPVFALYPSAALNEEEEFLYTPISDYDPTTDNPVIVLRPDGDALVDSTTFTLADSSQVEWGAWNLDADQVAEIESTEESGLVDELTEPFFYALAEPINTADLAGTSSFSLVEDFAQCGGDCMITNYDYLESASGNLSADFDTGLAYGSLNVAGGFDEGGYYDWDLAFTGMLEGAEFIGSIESEIEISELNLTLQSGVTVDSNLINDTLNGSVSGIFTGSDGSVYFIGNFNAQAGNNETYGVFLLEEVPGGVQLPGID